MAELSLFPLARRAGLIRSQASFYLGCGPEGAERNLARVLRQQGEAIQRKGFSTSLVDAEIAELEGAIRREIAARSRQGLGA